jgi:hypothetical protein
VEDVVSSKLSGSDHIQQQQQKQALIQNYQTLIKQEEYNVEKLRELESE